MAQRIRTEAVDIEFQILRLHEQRERELLAGNRNKVHELDDQIAILRSKVEALEPPPGLDAAQIARDPLLSEDFEREEKLKVKLPKRTVVVAILIGMLLLPVLRPYPLVLLAAISSWLVMGFLGWLYCRHRGRWIIQRAIDRYEAKVDQE